MRYFVTGTDTSVGKTVVSCGLLARARAAGASTSGLKPVAAGAEKTLEGLRNEDALALASVSTVELSYALRNPVCLAPPIAPHVALAHAGQTLSVRDLVEALEPAFRHPADLTLIEGAGGWLVPLNAHESFADLACALNIPVILVVGIRLGCLNHALLTAASIGAMGAQLAGWVANTVDPGITERDASIATLQARLNAPCMGVIPFEVDPSPERIAGYLPNLSRVFP